MDKRLVLADITACTYCKHYQWRGSLEKCQNKDSPYCIEDNSYWLWDGIDLTLGQQLLGCEKISYNGKKIPGHFFKKIPKESQLRKLPLAQIIKDFTEDMDLEPEVKISDGKLVFI